jgi:acetoin utilization protein AcuB
MTTAMTIGQVMHPCPVALTPHHTLAEAHGTMRVHNIRHLPVEEAGRLVGVVSQGDLRLLESLEPLDTRLVEVEDAMTPDPYAVGPDEPLREVIGEMWARRIGSALIVEHGAVVGIFTCVDALAVLQRLLDRNEQEGQDTGTSAQAGPSEATGFHR